MDVAQEVFVRWWADPGAYDPARGSLLTWLKASTRRRAIDWLRHEVAVHRREEAVGRSSVDLQEGVANAVVGRAMSQDLSQALAQLRPAQREAVSLAFLHDLSYRKVAMELNIPEGTAKARIRKGLRLLGVAMAAWRPADVAIP